MNKMSAACGGAVRRLPGDAVPCLGVGIDHASAQQAPMVVDQMEVDGATTVDGPTPFLDPQNVRSVEIIGPDCIVHRRGQYDVAHVAVIAAHAGQNERLRLSATRIALHVEREISSNALSADVGWSEDRVVVEVRAVVVV